MAGHEPQIDGNGTLRVTVLNGWAASPAAWDLCRFMKDPGGSVPPPSLYSYVDQLEGRPEKDLVGDVRSVLVGWSMGGSSALRLACRYPERIAGLVLVAATPRMMEERDTGWRGMSPRRLEALRKGLELTHGEGFFGIPEGKPNPYMMDTPENLERGLKYLLETDIRDEIERVFGGGCGFPVHIFQSGHDGIVRSSNAHWLKEMFPDAVLTVVDGSEHALPVSVPGLLDDAVTSILAGIRHCSPS